mmetsp:Transcript_11334/g.25370  ORF Transcript_11334/g.25370 Transcript_11334/m.25370 type:complete len:239 (-) Transcript_11334:393-1109(-)
MHELRDIVQDITLDGMGDVFATVLAVVYEQCPGAVGGSHKGQDYAYGILQGGRNDDNARVCFCDVSQCSSREAVASDVSDVLDLIVVQNTVAPDVLGSLLQVSPGLPGITTAEDECRQVLAIVPLVNQLKSVQPPPHVVFDIYVEAVREVWLSTRSLQLPTGRVAGKQAQRGVGQQPPTGRIGSHGILVPDAHRRVVHPEVDEGFPENCRLVQGVGRVEVGPCLERPLHQDDVCPVHD